jgi:hypothetical protein
MAVVATRDSLPAASSKTAPIGAIDHDDGSRGPTKPVVAIPRVAPAAPPPEMPRAAAPVTVIPVPPLPSVQKLARAGRLEPVVRTNSASVPAPVPATAGYQFAKGTGPVDPTTPSRDAPMSDDTEPNLRVGDRTKPGIALPPAARAVQLPSVKRRMAMRR